MTTVEFYFFNGTSRWYWIREWYTGNVYKSIAEYLEQKKLPFEEMSVSDIKYRLS